MIFINKNLILIHKYVYKKRFNTHYNIYMRLKNIII